MIVRLDNTTSVSIYPLLFYYLFSFSVILSLWKLLVALARGIFPSDFQVVLNIRIIRSRKYGICGKSFVIWYAVLPHSGTCNEYF